MQNYNQFHDGSIDALWFDGDRFHISLTTAERDTFAMVAEGVAALSADAFRKGNIVFDVLTRTHEELTPSDIETVYELRDGDAGRDDCVKLLAKARDQKLMVLEISPSYGGTCTVLARSFELFTRKKWLEQYLAVSR